MAMRVGFGYDVHKYTGCKKLILGGVDIPFGMGLTGHSDADVLVHAVMDALLGAAALGDIGEHFPDTDPKYKGISSITLLERVRDILGETHFSVGNIDATVVAQAPKLSPYKEQMAENIAAALGIEKNRVSVKATTEENLGFTGRMEGVAAYAVCMVNEFDVINSNDKETV